MDLPDLPPDIAFPRLPRTAEADEFAFEAKCAALRPHIVRRWPWGEAFQRDLHRRRFAERPFFAIRSGGRALGTLSFQVAPDHVTPRRFSQPWRGTARRGMA